MQSCNGLLLCCSYQERLRKYYVYNPTTKQSAVIPPVLGGMAVRNNIYFMGLAFHQTDCAHYKLVCFYRPKPRIQPVDANDVLKIQIFSSDTGKWKISDALLPLSIASSASFSNAFYWNQAFYWAPCCANPLYFKLDKQEFRSLPLPAPVASPEGCENRDVPLYFGESRGHLHLVRTAESFLHLSVYEMLSDHSGWFLKYRVELDGILKAYPEMIRDYVDPLSRGYYEFDVFDVVRGEEEDEISLVIRVPGKLIRYNAVDKSFKQISDQIYVYRPTGDLSIHRYIESLVSV